MVLPLEDLVLLNPVVTGIFFVLSYFIVGASVKFIDDAFDENVFSKKISFILAPVTAIFWAYLMALNPASAMLLTAIIVGVLVKGKIDTLAFVVAVICVYTAFFFMGSFDFLFNLMLPLALISAAGVMDEVGNDWVDKNNIYQNYKPFGKYVHLFFEYRFVMKIAVLLFALIGFFPLIFFFAFLSWDIGYATVMNISRRIRIERKFYYSQTA